MRWLKRLLLCLYIYIGVFAVVCFIAWCITGEEPAALIAGVFGGVGIESIVSGIIKVKEDADERKRMRLESKLNKDNENSTG